jgi:hypothetical protein
MRINIMLKDNQIVRTRRYKHACLVAMPPWALKAVGDPDHFRVSVKNNCVIYRPVEGV